MSSLKWYPDTLMTHVFERHFGAPPATESQITEFEATYGLRLPMPIRTMYLLSNGIRFFSKTESPFRIVEISEIRRTRVDLFGIENDKDSYGDPRFFTICRVGDSDVIAVRVCPENDEVRFYDCFHETFGRPGMCALVAFSVWELIHRIINSRGKNFALDKNFVPYDYF